MTEPIARPRPDGNGVYIASADEPDQHDMSIKVVEGEVRISMRARDVSVYMLQLALNEAYELQGDEP